MAPEERDASDLDLVVAGIESGITMVEAGANEVPEDVIADALAWPLNTTNQPLSCSKNWLRKLSRSHKRTHQSFLMKMSKRSPTSGLMANLVEAVRKPYPERNELVNQLRWDFHEAMAAKVGEDYGKLRDAYDEAFTSAVHKDVRKGIIDDNLRPDGRKLDEVRPLSSEVGVLPRTHGSSLFTRGLTQALNIINPGPTELRTAC